MPPSAVLLLLAALLVACTVSASRKPPVSLGNVKYDYEPLPNNTAVYGTSVRSPTTLDVYYLFGWNGYPKSDNERPANAAEAAAACAAMGLQQPDEFHPEDYKWTAFLDNMNRVKTDANPAGYWGSWVKPRAGQRCTHVYDLAIEGWSNSLCDWWRGMYVCVKRDPKCGSLRCCFTSACCSGKICCHTGTKCCKATLQRSFPVCVQSGKACPP